MTSPDLTPEERRRIERRVEKLLRPVIPILNVFAAAIVALYLYVLYCVAQAVIGGGKP